MKVHKSHSDLKITRTKPNTAIFLANKLWKVLSNGITLQQGCPIIAWIEKSIFHIAVVYVYPVSIYPSQFCIPETEIEKKHSGFSINVNSTMIKRFLCLWFHILWGSTSKAKSHKKKQLNTPQKKSFILLTHIKSCAYIYKRWKTFRTSLLVCSYYVPIC